MNNLLVNPRTKKQVDLFLAQPSQAILIVGSKGSGKAVLAKNIATNLLELDTQEKLESYPYFIKIKKLADKQNISIDQVRELITNIKLKVPGKREIRRVIYIESAENLNQESANAILKILEEPSQETLYILSCSSPGDLPLTIVSRCQIISVGTVSQTVAQKHLNISYDKELVDTAWRLSEGRAGLMIALLSEDKDHPLKKGIERAKKYIHMSTYQRLLEIDELSKNKEEIDNLLEGLGRVLAALSAAAVNKNESSKVKKIVSSRRLVQKLQSTIEKNGSTRLALLSLSINLVR